MSGYSQRDTQRHGTRPVETATDPHSGRQGLGWPSPQKSQEWRARNGDSFFVSLPLLPLWIARLKNGKISAHASR